MKQFQFLLLLIPFCSMAQENKSMQMPMGKESGMRKSTTYDYPLQPVQTKPGMAYMG